MEALVTRARYALLLASIANVLYLPQIANAASHRTENFIVTAATKELAAAIARTAEQYRKQLAVEWLGRELPRWSEPCPIIAKVGPRLGAGGATSFLFETQGRYFARPVSHRSQSGDGLFQAKPVGRPYGWEMSVQGTRQRVLDSVLPHEVTHAIFATHFGRPLPRWADEGACTTVEHPAEKSKQHRMLYEFLKTDRGIAFNRMFSMNEYPADILPLYAQGFSLSRFLIAQGGKRKFVKYIGDGLDSNNWTQSTERHYGFKSLSELQVTWLDWVREGSPKLPKPDSKPTLLASQTRPVSLNSRAPGPMRPVADTKTKASDWRNTPLQENFPKSRDTSEPTTGSWYVSRSQAVRNNPTAASQRKPNSQREVAFESAAAPRGIKPELSYEPARKSIGTRVASRPEAELRPREVLLEWGRPSTFLAPQLGPAPIPSQPTAMRQAFAPPQAVSR